MTILSIATRFGLASILAVSLTVTHPGGILASNWGPSGCGPVVTGSSLLPPPAYSSPSVYAWKKSVDSDEYFLYRNSYWIGNWKDGIYRPYNGVSFDPPCSCPCVPPVGVNPVPERKEQIEKLPDWALDGVKWDLVKKSCERFSIDGEEITKRQAFGLLGDDLPNESAKPWIVVVDEDKAGILDKLKEFNSKYRIQVYKPSDWEVDDRKLKPGLTVMLPDGTALLDGVPFDVEALRKINPVKPSPAPLPMPVRSNQLVWMGAVASLLIWLLVFWKAR